MDSAERPSKRTRTACDRCKQRKQRCDNGYPSCTNCAKASVPCNQPALHPQAPRYTHALEERIAYLEAQLARVSTPPATTVASSERITPAPSVSSAGPPDSVASPPAPSTYKDSNTAQIASFLTLGRDAAYVGSSSGFPLAANLAELVQASVWSKSLLQGNSVQMRAAGGDLTEGATGAPPPEEPVGARIVNSYMDRLHPRYPFLDREEIWRLHTQHLARPVEPTSYDPEVDKFSLFKIYMVYAIGSAVLRLTEPYAYTAPEAFYAKALQYISNAHTENQSESVQSIETMVLLIMFHLRTVSSTGIWYMTGLAMRTCVDLGLHRKSHFLNEDPFERQMRRRLFWTVYSLERSIAIALGRPYSISDRDIDVELPIDIEDTVRDPATLEHAATLTPSPSQRTNLSMAVHLFRLRQIESRIQASIYRLDRHPSTMLSKRARFFIELSNWHASLPPFEPYYSSEYPLLNYHKAVLLLLQPFLTHAVDGPGDPYFSACVRAAGQICQSFKRLHAASATNYGHSFIAVQFVFISGITLAYALWMQPAVWNVDVSEDLRACSSVLFVMAERSSKRGSPQVRAYRDAFEGLVDATMASIRERGAGGGGGGGGGGTVGMGQSGRVAVGVKLQRTVLEDLERRDDGTWEMVREMTGSRAGGASRGDVRAVDQPDLMATEVEGGGVAAGAAGAAGAGTAAAAAGAAGVGGPWQPSVEGWEADIAGWEGVMDGLGYL